MSQDNTWHEGADFDWALEDFEDAAHPSLIDDPALPVSLTTDLIPLDRDGMYVPNHQDETGTLHFFAVVDISDQPNFDDPALPSALLPRDPDGRWTAGS